MRHLASECINAVCYVGERSTKKDGTSGSSQYFPETGDRPHAKGRLTVIIISCLTNNSIVQ